MGKMTEDGLEFTAAGPGGRDVDGINVFAVINSMSIEGFDKKIIKEDKKKNDLLREKINLRAKSFVL